MRASQSWFASTERTRNRGGASCRRPAIRRSSRPPPCWRRRGRPLSSPARRRERPDMAILIDDRTRVVVQGITGREGTFHTLRNRAYGTNVVAGVTPGKGGQDVDGIPVFDTVADAVAEAGANTSLIFVPARFAVDALYEAVDAGVCTVVHITENIPVLDMT